MGINLLKNMDEKTGLRMQTGFGKRNQ